MDLVIVPVSSLRRLTRFTNYNQSKLNITSEQVNSIIPWWTFFPSAELMCGFWSGHRITETIIHFGAVIPYAKSVTGDDTW